uniref:CUB_2 domain-containing protein n=1 Tax=Caenorhabditis tropicalis TaxID=1561998 RepID=A0A1I7TTT6_9PELO
MYTIHSQILHWDIRVVRLEGLEQSPAFFNPYLIYSANPKVSGKGSIQLPLLSLPGTGQNFWFTMTMQDNGPMNVVKTSLLKWTIDGNTDQIGLLNGNAYGFTGGNYVCDWPNMQQSVYNMTLDYEYLDSKTRTLQIRIHQNNSTTLNYWPPYDN